VQALLVHLGARGFAGAPAPGGLDEQGREVVAYLDGDVPAYPLPAWVTSLESLAAAGRLLRALHDATRDFRPPPGAVWRELPGAPADGGVVCHNDVAPYNTVYRDGCPVAFIDWDFAAPGPPEWDLAHAAWRFAGLGEGDPRAAGRRLGVLCDAYGWTDLPGLLDVVVRRQHVLHGAIGALDALAPMRGTEHERAPLRHAAWVREHCAVLAAG
jgi:aminoglycoside phosphotransferase (APT) family kinase protein